MKPYDLESAIMDAWNVESDLKALIEVAKTDPDSVIEAIKGIIHISNARFSTLFKMYEEVCFDKDDNES